MQKLYLICNAHLDPVWLWEWEEGAAEALSTFRTAADFCEEYDGFIFNHNEAILYKWVEEYDPALFVRIRKLVKEGKWRIIGGWHLQPDCNMPSGESIVRHILAGRRYFREKFDAEPTTAINFDSFGHSRGLVQIFKKAGYDSYIVCRAGANSSEMKERDFIWVGFDGSEIIVHRSDENYNSVRGQVGKELEQWLKENSHPETGLFLWGIGNHGGGPSRIDLEAIEELKTNASMGPEIVHSYPEAYFHGLKSGGTSLPRYYKSLNPVAEGCYTSQIRIKQLHRQLENEIYMVEKMASNASLQGFMRYPEQEINAALYDLTTAEFHDALPGSSIQPVENASIRLIYHGLEITSRLRAKAFFALLGGQEKVKDGEAPIFIYNPHPFKIKGIFECEFVIPSQNWDDTFAYPLMYQDGKRMPCQAEQEYNNFKIDWRKHAVFEVELQPSQINRFDCRFEYLREKPGPVIKSENDKIKFKTDTIEVEINCKTGLMDKYIINGVDFIKGNAFLPVVIKDSYNSWRGLQYKNKTGEFSLMQKAEGTRFSGLPGDDLESVRIIEDGEVRTVIEAVFSYENSSICQQYKLPKQGSEIQIDVRVFWNEKDRALKLSIPTALNDASYIGQTIYGVDELDGSGGESVSQKWSAAISEKDKRALTCINDCIYGSGFKEGEIGLTLLRSASYATSDFDGKPALPKDRFTPRMDQGERVFSFWINGGELHERMEVIDREALVHNEKPYALSCCPPGAGQKPAELVVLSDRAVQLAAFKKAEAYEDYIIRLFEPTGQKRKTVVEIPLFNINQEIVLDKYEIKTLRLSVDSGTLVETDILD